MNAYQLKGFGLGGLSVVIGVVLIYISPPGINILATLIVCPGVPFGIALFADEASTPVMVKNARHGFTEYVPFYPNSAPPFSIFWFYIGYGLLLVTIVLLCICFI